MQPQDIVVSLVFTFTIKSPISGGSSSAPDQSGGDGAAAGPAAQQRPSDHDAGAQLLTAAAARRPRWRTAAWHRHRRWHIDPITPLAARPEQTLGNVRWSSTGF